MNQSGAMLRCLHSGMGVWGGRPILAQPTAERAPTLQTPQEQAQSGFKPMRHSVMAHRKPASF